MTSSGVLLTRLVLGYVLALPFVTPWLANSIGADEGYAFVLRMSSTIGGELQLFYDIGFGHSPQFLVRTPQNATETQFEYRLPLPPATYRSFRIDPAVGAGRYTIERASITREADESTAVTIPLMELEAVQQLSILERTPERLVFSVPSGSNDPILLWTPSAPLRMMPAPSRVQRMLIGIALFWAGGVAVVWMIGELLRRAPRVRFDFTRRAAMFCASTPAAAVVVTAFVATVLATYPVLFAGRSLVSPTNGPTSLLYEQPPFTPGADDFAIEDVRGSDVGAMMWQSLPHSQIEREAVSAGEIPLWNRYTALGRPLWGQGLSYVLDPLQWLTFVGSNPAATWDLKFIAHRFLFATGAGLVALAATGAWLPAGMVTAAAPFVGAFAYRFNHPAVFSLTYAPWTLLGWLLLARATSAAARARAAIFLTLGTALLLVAPTPKEGAISVLCVTATGAVTVLLSAGSWPQRRQRLGAAALAGIAVVLLTAPHWLLFLDTVSQSAHAYDIPSVYVGGFRHTVGLWISPLTPLAVLPGLHLFALILVVAALSAPLHLWNNRVALASLLVAALMLAVALGAVPTAWLLALPLVSQVSHLWDVLFMASVTPLLVVAAAGAQVLCHADSARTLVVTVATALAAVWLLARVTEIGQLNLFDPWAAALLLPLMVAWPACLLRARRGSTGASLAAGATMAALLLPGGLHLETGIANIDQLLSQPRPRPRLNETSPAVDAIHAAAKTAAPTRTTGIGSVLFPGSSVLYGWEDIRGTDPLEVPAYRELIDASGMQRHTFWVTSFDHVDIPRVGPVLDMLNVGFLMASADAVPPAGTVLAMQGPDVVRAIQRPSPWPRAFFVDGATTYTKPTDLVHQVAAQRTPFAAILDGDTSAVDATRGLPRSTVRAVPAEGYVLTANTTSFRIRTDREGIAVLGETYLPGDFIATLNGREVSYFRVNHVFKAVRIPGAGEWTVRFDYRPRRWGLALGAAGLGALVLLTLVLSAWRDQGKGRRPLQVESAA